MNLRMTVEPAGPPRGPNARLFAAMANRPEVRLRLRERGIDIPDDTWFVGGYHDTCSDDVQLFDLDALPPRTNPMWTAFASTWNWPAHTMPRSGSAGSNRARRSESPGRTPACGRAKRAPGGAAAGVRALHNAVCVVGRRAHALGSSLTGEAFLVSYDANRDPADQSLATLMAAVVPVCAGISLEYYFSFVDNDRYGCGTKLPHNVTGLVGVMDGHAGDLRTGSLANGRDPRACAYPLRCRDHAGA